MIIVFRRSVAHSSFFNARRQNLLTKKQQQQAEEEDDEEEEDVEAKWRRIQIFSTQSSQIGAGK